MLLFLQASLPMMGFDLRGIDAEATCVPGASDEIVVCGSRRQDEKYRLRPLARDDFESRLPTAQIGILGNGTANVETEAYAMPGGATSNRVMLKITKPF